MYLLNKYFQQKKKREFLFIFIGDLGANVLNELYNKNQSDYYFLAINSDASHLNNNVRIPDECKIFIGDQPEYSCGKRDFESGLEYITQNKKLIKRTIKRHPAKQTILVAGLRYSSASGIIAGISKIVKKSNTKAIVSTPFAAEGQNAFSNSFKALIRLNQNLNKVISFSCEDIMRENGGKLLIEDLDKKFFELIQENSKN
ncbi:MAG: hypothetical protein PHW82_10815 [Bacteroidales bacterium]|nr:hypothetical protein [Bacteroidales bacterium]